VLQVGDTVLYVIQAGGGTVPAIVVRVLDAETLDLVALHAPRQIAGSTGSSTFVGQVRRSRTPGQQHCFLPIENDLTALRSENASLRERLDQLEQDLGAEPIVPTGAEISGDATRAPGAISPLDAPPPKPRADADRKSGQQHGARR